MDGSNRTMASTKATKGQFPLVWPCAIPTAHLAKLPAPLLEEELTSFRCGTASTLLVLSFSSTEHAGIRNIQMQPTWKCELFPCSSPSKRIDKKGVILVNVSLVCDVVHVIDDIFIGRDLVCGYHIHPYKIVRRVNEVLSIYTSVPHKAVAEVSRIGDYRRDWLL